MMVISKDLLKKQLYHGTTSNFQTPDLSKSRENLDFGRGFYLTTIEKQAKEFANILERKNKFKKDFAGKRINQYLIEADEQILKNSIKITCYEQFNRECMYYILKCRSMKDDKKTTDIIMGSVADGKGKELIEDAKELISDLQSGDITEEELFEELHELVEKFRFTTKEGNNKYTNQIVLKSDKIIKYLKFKGIISR